MKLNRLNVDQNKIYSCKFELVKIDSMIEFTNVQCAHRLLYCTRQVGGLAPPKHAAAYLV